MVCRWLQLRCGKGEMQKWVLVHKETNRILLEVSLSNHAEPYWNWKVRKRIQRAYELYYGKVWFKTLKFF